MFELTLLLGATNFFDCGQGWVSVQGTEHVAKIDGVHCAISLKIVDGENEVRS